MSIREYINAKISEVILFESDDYSHESILSLAESKSDILEYPLSFIREFCKHFVLGELYQDNIIFKTFDEAEFFDYLDMLNKNNIISDFDLECLKENCEYQQEQIKKKEQQTKAINEAFKDAITTLEKFDIVFEQCENQVDYLSSGINTALTIVEKTKNQTFLTNIINIINNLIFTAQQNEGREFILTFSKHHFTHRCNMLKKQFVKEQLEEKLYETPYMDGKNIMNIISEYACDY